MSDINGVAADQLRSIIERIERLHEEKAAISDDIKEIYAEAKSNGLDTKVIRQIVKERGQDPAALQEFETIVDLYKSAIGMIPATRDVHDAGEAINTSNNQETPQPSSFKGASVDRPSEQSSDEVPRGDGVTFIYGQSERKNSDGVRGGNEVAGSSSLAPNSQIQSFSNQTEDA